MSEQTATAVADAPAVLAKPHATKYTRNQPYASRVLVNSRLTGSESEKETIHIELAVEEGMTYTPGDAVGIVPTNREGQVMDVLEMLGFTGTERVLDFYKKETDVHDALTQHLGIGKLARGSVNHYAKLFGESIPQGLKELQGQGNKARAEEYVWGREFIDLIQEFPGGITNPQQLFTVLQRLTPRMYSISSSQAAHPDSVHTTVRVIKYHAYGLDREGVCSGQMGDRAPVGAHMPIFLHENNAFRLPQSGDAPVIMIGPGTGIAPFRAFLEQRQAFGERGPMWLFFGEQRRVSDFLYEEQFGAMLRDGTLTKLDTAFSRDTSKKVYVQDRMRENAKDLYDWLERGAYFYVCGDASRMARDVETALLDVIAQGANGTLEHANEYLAEMKKARRYQRDVY